MAKKYIDSDGLAHIWGKIKAYVANAISGQSTATTSAKGLMSSTDKAKLNKLPNNEFGRIMLTANTSEELTLMTNKTYMVSTTSNVWIVFSYGASSTPIIKSVVSTETAGLSISAAANRKLTLSNTTAYSYYFQVNDLINK